MPIDAELILRQAREVQRLELDRARGEELAEEAKSLIANAFIVSNTANFDDDPDRFIAALWLLRDKDWAAR